MDNPVHGYTYIRIEMTATEFTGALCDMLPAQFRGFATPDLYHD
jgi:hypothetical protein